MAETLTFNPADLGAVPEDEFDPATIGAAQVEELDPSSLGAEPVQQEAPQTFGDKASRVMAASGEQALQAGSMLTRIFEPNQMVQFLSSVSRELGGPTLDEVQMELEGAASRSQDEWGVNPTQGDSFLSKVATGAGSIIPALASGPLAPVTTALSMGEQGLQEAKEAGGTPVQQFGSAALNAVTGLVTEKLLGVPALLKAAKASKVPEATFKNLVGIVAKQAGMGFVREGSQETLEQLSSDVIAKYLAAYDPDRNVFDPKKLLTTFAAGGVVGAPVAGTLSLAANAAPEEIAPKEEMQDIASEVDAELANLVAEPVTGSEPVTQPSQAVSEPLPTNETQTETPPTQTAPEVLSQVQPQVEGESVVSTAIQLPSGEVVTGQDFNSPHASLLMEALDKGLPETEYEQNLGFVVQDDQGKQRFASREEALEIARKTGQLDETKLTQNTKGLQSEGLVTPKKPAITPDEAATQIEQYRAAGIAMAKQRGASDLIAEDIFQEVQNDLTQKLASGEVTTKNLGAFVSRAVQNKTIDKVRAEQARAGRQEAQETPEVTTRGPRAETVSKEEIGSIEQALDKLPGKQGQTIRLTAEGKTDAEIASELGMTEGAVQQAKSRARQAMKEFLRSQGIGESMAPGAANEREFQRARFIAATDLYQNTDNQIEWENEMSRVYEDVFSKEELDDLYDIAREVSSEYAAQKGAKPIPKIISQMMEMEKTGEGFTAAANRHSDAERKARGLPPAKRLLRTTNPRIYDDTIRMMEEDKQFQFNLIQRLKNNPRSAITEHEVFALVDAKINAQNRYHDALDTAQKATDEKTRLEALGKAREAEAELNDIEDISVAAGSVQGTAFQARKQLISRDYSVFRLRSELKAEQGSPLTEKQEQLVQDVSENVQRLESEVETRRDELEGEQSKQEYESTFKEFQNTPGEFDSRIMEIARKIVAKLDQEADKARKRIRSRMANASSGVDPTVLYDVAVIGSSKIAHGLLDFAQWSAAMKQEFGDWIEPYLRAGYEQANARIDRMEETVDSKDREKVKRAVRKQGSQGELQNWKDSVKTRTEKGESLNDLRATIQRMALNLVRNGVNTSEGLLDAMQGILEPMRPGITRREVMDLISGYGDLKALDMEKAKVTLRDLKGQMQQVAKIQDIEKGHKPKKTGIERRVPSKEERELIRQVNEAREKFGVGTLDAYKARLQNQITDLELKIKRGDFRRKIKNLVDISKDAEAVKLLAEAERWRKKFQDARYEARKAQETKLQRAGRYGKEILNVPRAVKSSLDFSAVLRQGGFVGFGNPVRAVKNLPSMFKSAFSQSQFEKSEAEIRSRPNAPLYKQSKLYLANMDGDLTNREETFRSEWAEKIPGVKGSNRAYIAYLNRMRADTFDALVGNLGFTPTTEQLKAIAHYVNVATGRGDLGAHGAAAETLSTVLWSPRLLVSRFQLLAGEPLARGDAAGVRKVIAREYAKTIAAGAVILSLAAMWGIDVEKDPRSSDFGKLVIGNTRIDPWMGLQQISVLAFRLLSGETKTLSGEVVPIRGEERPKFGQTGFDVASRFVRTKMTPLLGEFFNVASGENVIGEKTTPASTAVGLTAPLVLTDILPMLEEQGLSKTAAMTVLNLFGASVQHHEQKD